MKLTITKKPFKGKPVGSEVEMNDKQARLLTKMGRAQYMTRVMTAEAPPRAQAPVPAPAPAPAAAAPVSVRSSLDSAGAAWDDKVHAPSRLKNSDGTWRKRAAAKPAEGAAPPAEQ